MSVIRGSRSNIIHEEVISLANNPIPDFDWYRATIHGLKPAVILHEMARIFPSASTRKSGGRFGYDRGAKLHAGEHDILTVWWSSNGRNKGVCVDAPSGASGKVKKALEKYNPRVTRADVRLDYCEAGLFDYLAARFEKFAVENNIKLEHQGDWKRGAGRTLYVGSRSSTAFLRLYEKGHKEGGDPNWIRLELECKPKGDAGYKVAKLEAGDYFACSQWVRMSFDEIGIRYGQGEKIGTMRKPDDFEKAKLAMLKQYKRVILQWIESHESPEDFVYDIVAACELREEWKLTGERFEFAKFMNHVCEEKNPVEEPS